MTMVITQVRKLRAGFRRRGVELGCTECPSSLKIGCLIFYTQRSREG
jgi:hypothetical protein